MHYKLIDRLSMGTPQVQISVIFFYILYTVHADVCNVKSDNFDITTFLNSLKTPNPDILAPHKAYGILHTLQNYTKWAAREEEIVKLLKKRLDLINMETLLIKDYLQDYEESSAQAIKHARVSTHTPEERGRIIGKSAVLGHRMTYRYANILASLRRHLASTDYLENLGHLNKTMKLDDPNAKWVNKEDLFMSMNSILHLADVYKFLPSKLLNGRSVDTLEGGKFNPTHCQEMGVFALYRGRHFMAFEWLEIIPQTLESEFSQISQISRDLINSVTRLTQQVHNRVLSSVATGKNTNFGDMTGVYFHPLTHTTTTRRYKMAQTLRHPSIIDETNFSWLCNGKTLQKREVAKRLHCYYEIKQHPYLFINPVKTEVLLDDPPVLQFYEVIGDRTIAEIEQQSFTERLKPSRIFGEDTAEGITAFRTSVGTAVKESEMPKSVYKFAEILTGLKVLGNSEATQYVEYAYGRYYTYHDDASDSSNDGTAPYLEETGDRMATLLYYLEVADAGGCTVFPKAKISTRPERGSAVLWYNLYRNGSYISDMKHGSCPVIHGHKIVMNHWVFYRGSWNRRKCALNQFE